MINYQSFEWSESEALNEDYKQMLIQRMQKQQNFDGITLVIFLLLLSSPFLLMLKNDITHGGWIVFAILLAVFMLAVIALVKLIGAKRLRKLQSGDFVWRIGTVTNTHIGGRYRTAKSWVNGQPVPYIFGAGTGDTVIVIGFDTDQNSKTLATFYATKI